MPNYSDHRVAWQESLSHACMYMFTHTHTHASTSLANLPLSDVSPLSALTVQLVWSPFFTGYCLDRFWLLGDLC